MGTLHGHPMMPPVAPTSGLAIASMTCGIVGIMLSTGCVGVIGGLPAVICGHAALRSIKTSPIPVRGNGMAITGLVTGYLACVSSLWLVFLLMSAMM
jgi:hypothetical protein